MSILKHIVTELVNHAEINNPQEALEWFSSVTKEDIEAAFSELTLKRFCAIDENGGSYIYAYNLTHALNKAKRIGLNPHTIWPCPLSL